MLRLPTFFLSIGGPQFLETPNHPAAVELRKIGKQITQTIKPKAILVISAHWADESSHRVSINVAEDAGLIYDFYGFPDWYYKVEYPYRGSKEIAGRVKGLLEGHGVKVQPVKRGLDHGVWVGFQSAFDTKTNPLGDIPVIQLSMYGNEDPEMHYRLGEALQELRQEGILIIGAGMAVHNLPDFRRARGNEKPLPYTSTFDDILKDAVTAMPDERKAAMMALTAGQTIEEAHPTLEHLLPMYVVAGAAGEDVGERLWTFPQGSLNWAQYRFGDVVTSEK